MVQSSWYSIPILVWIIRVYEWSNRVILAKTASKCKLNESVKSTHGNGMKDTQCKSTHNPAYLRCESRRHQYYHCRDVCAHKFRTIKVGFFLPISFSSFSYSSIQVFGRRNKWKRWAKHDTAASDASPQRRDECFLFSFMLFIIQWLKSHKWWYTFSFSPLPILSVRVKNRATRKIV